MEINNLKNKLDIRYYKSLKEYSYKNNIDYEWISQHIDILVNGNIKSINNVKPFDETFCKENIIEESSNNKNNSSDTEKYKQIFDDQDLYKKSWNKLNITHKIIKIKEFINNNCKIDNDEDKNKLKDDLTILIKTKILSKKDKVTYDETMGKIINIPNLQYKDGKYYYHHE